MAQPAGLSCLPGSAMVPASDRHLGLPTPALTADVTEPGMSQILPHGPYLLGLPFYPVVIKLRASGSVLGGTPPARPEWCATVRLHSSAP